MSHSVLGVFEIGEEAQAMGHDAGVVIVLDFSALEPTALIGAIAMVKSETDHLFTGVVGGAQVHAGATSLFFKGLDYAIVEDAATVALASA
jgi:hypothetical protein